jgi:hypothetical protein
MTPNEVKTRLVAFLDQKENVDSLQQWLLSVSGEASKYGDEVETLVGSVGYLLARLATGLTTEIDFRSQLRILADVDTVAMADQPTSVGKKFCSWKSGASTSLLGKLYSCRRCKYHAKRNTRNHPILEQHVYPVEPFFIKGHNNWCNDS